MTDLDYFMTPKDIAPEVASCYQTQQTSDPSMNQSPGISQGTGATFEGGTKRSGRKPAYHLVPIELMEAVARTREEGDRKYAPGNWMKGNKEFFVDCLGHAIEHLQLCVWDEEEDLWTHLGHAATNIAFEVLAFNLQPPDVVDCLALAGHLRKGFPSDLRGRFFSGRPHFFVCLMDSDVEPGGQNATVECAAAASSPPPNLNP